MEAVGADPALLDKLELALEVGIEAHEEEAPRLSFLVHMGPPPAQQAVAVGDAQLERVVRGEAVARESAADMRSEWAAHALRIRVAIEKGART